jgi:hypothetical protein
LGAADETRRERVSLDVAAEPHKAAGFLDQVRLESTLVDVAFAKSLPMLVQAQRMGSRYPMHQA